MIAKLELEGGPDAWRVHAEQFLVPDEVCG